MATGTGTVDVGVGVGVEGSGSAYAWIEVGMATRMAVTAAAAAIALKPGVLGPGVWARLFISAHPSKVGFGVVRRCARRDIPAAILRANA